MHTCNRECRCTRGKERIHNRGKDTYSSLLTCFIGIMQAEKQQRDEARALARRISIGEVTKHAQTRAQSIA